MSSCSLYVHKVVELLTGSRQTFSENTDSWNSWRVNNSSLEDVYVKNKIERIPGTEWIWKDNKYNLWDIFKAWCIYDESLSAWGGIRIKATKRHKEMVKVRTEIYETQKKIIQKDQCILELDFEMTNKTWIYYVQLTKERKDEPN